MTTPYLMAIDQGTTSSRAIVFDLQGSIIASEQEEFTQHYPHNGWVEHDPEGIWQTSLRSAQRALQKAEAHGGRVAAIGITNQRETTLLWRRDDHRCLAPAIVWQDRRTADRCQALKDSGEAEEVRARTGLVCDPYFSATKIEWLLDNIPHARSAAERGELAFGTVDTFLLWRLTHGRVHATDATNASRTNLFNLRSNRWDDDLLRIFRVPRAILPQVKNSADDFGVCDAQFFGREIPILGIAGDQQAATFGQACFQVGDTKSTYGTGCFALMNIGETPVLSQHQLLTTVAYRLNNVSTYALEGSIFIAGAAVQWLRDELGVIQHAEETEGLAASLNDNGGVVLVPAFTGLGAPYWRADVRGALMGLTRGAGRAHLARAALESVCYQTRDLLDAMAADAAMPARVRVDGGMVNNNWLMQFLADMIGVPIDRPVVTETTAIGVAYLAGLQAGFFNDLTDIQRVWQRQESFQPSMPDAKVKANLQQWRAAVDAVLSKRA